MAQDDAFLHGGNIRRFEQKLSEATDAGQRRVLRQLLAAERARVLDEAGAGERVRPAGPETRAPNAED
jgi:hypothetical protein